MKEKVVPTEEERKALHDKENKGDRTETENILSKIFPKRAVAKIPIEFRGKKKPTAKPTAANTSVTGRVSLKSELVWESGKLTERPLNIPKGSNTNPTGSMYFTKGKMKGIDQRHYFRDDVFKELNWRNDPNPKSSHLERANATFRIIIDGKDYSKYKLKLTHNSKIGTATYEEKNSMTQIHWGDAKMLIAKDEHIGKTAKLFKTKKKDEFILEIS